MIGCSLIRLDMCEKFLLLTFALARSLSFSLIGCSHLFFCLDFGILNIYDICGRHIFLKYGKSTYICRFSSHTDTLTTNIFIGIIVERDINKLRVRDVAAKERIDIFKRRIPALIICYSSGFLHKENSIILNHTHISSIHGHFQKHHVYIEHVIFYTLVTSKII